MSPKNIDRTVVASMVVAESAWLFALLGVLGLVVGADAGPLGWLAVLALMAAGASVARFLSRLEDSVRVQFAAVLFPVVQAVAGAAAVYLVVASQINLSDSYFDLGWPSAATGSSVIEGANFRATVGPIVGVLLWWRGGRLGSSEEPGELLNRSYKRGTLMLVLAVLVDVGSDSSLHTFGALFVFFAATLAGLGVAGLGEANSGERGARIWLRAVAASVAGVLGVGLAFTLLRGEFLETARAPVSEVLGWMGTVLFWGVIVPVAWVIGGLISLFASLFSADGEPGGIFVDGGSFGEQFLERESGNTPAYVTGLEWALLVVFSVLVLYVLSRALRRRRRGRDPRVEGVRESVRGRSDPVYDAAGMLFDLLPSGLRRRRGARSIYLPPGPAGVVDALRSYYRLLLHAGKEGGDMPRSSTPAEYEDSLSGLVPGGLASRTTAAFNAAFYGGIEPPATDRKEISAELDRLGAPDLPDQEA